MAAAAAAARSPAAFALRREVLGLYKDIMRALPRLEEPAARTYYYNFTRTHFMQHADEEDEERVDELLQQGKKNFIWLKRKYGLDDEDDESD